MKKAKTGKLGQNAPSSGAAPGVEPPAKPSPKRALASGKPEFTPGPWETYLVLGFPRVIAEIGLDVADALMDGGKASGRQAEVTANAHLIAAAPDMYAVLEHIVQGVIDVHVVQMAREALAKARGGSDAG